MNCCNAECNQGRDCPYRGVITMSEGNKQWALGLLVGIVLTSLVSLSMNKMMATEPPMEVLPRTVIEAYNAGLKDALMTNPVSPALEMVCLDIWGRRQ